MKIGRLSYQQLLEVHQPRRIPTRPTTVGPQITAGALETLICDVTIAVGDAVREGCRTKLCALTEAQALWVGFLPAADRFFTPAIQIRVGGHRVSIRAQLAARSVWNHLEDELQNAVYPEAE